MSPLWEFVLRHGYGLVFLAVLLEQLGAPAPTAAVLLLAGALSALGHFSLPLFLLLAVAASLAADLVWYELGRRRGEAILGLLCRLSLEPSTCVRRTTATFERWGPATLLVAKFVPGLNTVAPPLAGSTGIQRGQFLWFSALGAAFWSGAFLGAGALLGREAERWVEGLSSTGAAALWALAAGAAGWIFWKLLWRWRTLRRLRIARILPHELHAMLRPAAGQPPLVVDLRSPAERRRTGARIPAAVLAGEEDLERILAGAPRSLPVVFYCSCPDEASSAAWALRLQRQGFPGARPLAGGFEAWLAAGYAAEPLPGPPSGP